MNNYVSIKKQKKIQDIISMERRNKDTKTKQKYNFYFILLNTIENENKTVIRVFAVNELTII